MINIANGCKWTAAAVVSIWFAVVDNAQARVIVLDNPYNPGEQVVLEFKGCHDTEVAEWLFPLLKQRQNSPSSVAAVAAPADRAPAIRIAMAPPGRTARYSLPLMLGVGF